MADMTIPKGRIEWNLNTVIMGIGFLVGVLTWGITIGMFASRVEEMDGKFTREIARIDARSDQRRSESEQRWRDHDQLHKDRGSENAAQAAKTEERFRAVESEVRKIDNLTYRVTVAEQSQVSTVQAVKDLQVIVNGQATDLKVMREILQRLDPGPARRPP